MSNTIHRSLHLQSHPRQYNPSQFKKQLNTLPINFDETPKQSCQNNDKQNNKQFVKLQCKLNQKPLLYLMSEQFEHSDIVPQNFKEKSCYQRFKMLIDEKNSSSQNNLHKSEKDRDILKNVIKFQNEINNLQKKYKSLKTSNSTFYNQITSKNSNNYINKCLRTYNQGDSKGTDSSKAHRSLYRQIKQQNINKKTQQTEFNQKKSKIKLLKTHENDHNISQKIVKAQDSKIVLNQYNNLSNQFKRSIKDQVNKLKQNCYQKFVKNKKDALDKKQVEFQFYIKNELQIKMEDIIKKQIFEYYKLKEQNTKLLTIILQKEIQIQMLIKESKYKDDRLGKIKTWNQPKQEKLSKDQEQSFYESYCNIFGKLTLNQLKFKIRQLEHVHSYQFPLATSKNLQINKMPDNSWQKDQLITKIVCLQNKEHELYELQKYILKKYTEWNTYHAVQHQKLPNGQIKDNFAVSNYYQIIDNMINLGDQHQNKEYAKSSHKIVNNLSKLKKIVGSINNVNKFNPIKALNEIQVFLGRKSSKKVTMKPPTKGNKKVKIAPQSSIHKIIIDQDQNFA